MQGAAAVVEGEVLQEAAKATEHSKTSKAVKILNLGLQPFFANQK